jgi:hypothetical protein
MSDFVFPTPPQNQKCPKCRRVVVVAVNPGIPGIENDCGEEDCPIAQDPNNEPFGSDGTLICFPEDELDSYVAGEQAAQDGLTAEKNPFEAGSVDHEEWARGWGTITGPTIDRPDLDPDFQD